MRYVRKDVEKADRHKENNEVVHISTMPER